MVAGSVVTVWPADRIAIRHLRRRPLPEQLQPQLQHDLEGTIGATAAEITGHTLTKVK